MSQIGTQVQYTVTPPSTTAPIDTANAFIVGLADWGPTTPVTISSLADTAAVVGPRTATNTTVYDALDVYFREAAPQSNAIFGRVVGPAASAASLTINDGSGSAALLVSAVYVGNYGNNVKIAVTNSGGSFVVSLTDTYGNLLATSPSFATRAAAAAWSNSYIKIVAYANTAGLPATLAATPLSGGTDDRSHVTITHWTNALNGFVASLGPGQVLAPGQTDTSLAGIWEALVANALAFNRVAIADCDDGQAASTIVADVGSTFNSLAVGPIGFWAGNLSAPGVTPGTTRSVPPSSVIAALCTRVDASGNPNLAAAGSSYPLQYCTGPATLVSGSNETYNATDRSTLNNAGVNVFANRYGTYENYGFVSSVLPTTDGTFWQLNHYRLRMAVGAEANAVAETFVFTQLDGAGNDLLSFNHSLTDVLGGFLAAGALFGTQPGTVDAAFAVDTGPTVNTPQTMQAGNLNAILYVRMSPFAELVTVTVSTTPITQSVPVASTSQSTGF